MRPCYALGKMQYIEWQLNCIIAVLCWAAYPDLFDRTQGIKAIVKFTKWTPNFENVKLL